MSEEQACERTSKLALFLFTGQDDAERLASEAKHGESCKPCRVTLSWSAEFRRAHWVSGTVLVGKHEDGQPIRERVNVHVLRCVACGIETTRQRDGSYRASFHFCKTAGALIAALDTFRWTVDGTIDGYMRRRYGVDRLVEAEKEDGRS